MYFQSIKLDNKIRKENTKNTATCHLLEGAWLLHTWGHIRCSYLHKTFTDQGSNDFSIDWGGPSKAPLLAEKLLTIDGFQGKESHFSLGMQPLVS